MIIKMPLSSDGALIKPIIKPIIIIGISINPHPSSSFSLLNLIFILNASMVSKITTL